MKKLAVVCSHPIQYYTPLFQLLANERALALKVFYTWGEQSLNKYDPGFKQNIQWDIPLLDGYEYEFLTNNSREPGSHHFKGIINPNAINSISQFNPDVILVFGWSYHSHLKIIRHFSGKVQLWFRGDSTLLDYESFFKRALKFFLLKWVYSHVDKVFYVGLNNRKYFERYGFKQAQLIFSPHAIDNTRFFKDHSVEASELRNRLKVSPEEILILFAGKLEEKKNPHLLLEAFVNLGKPNTHLLFVGNGELEQPLKNRVAKIENSSGMHSRIHFMSFQNQMKMPHIYQACDLFCLPSKGPGESWGLAVNEAMASGKAILVSNKVGCSADLVTTNINGAVFNSEVKNDLYSKLVHLTQSKDRLNKYGDKSKAIIKTWSLENALKNIISEIKNHKGYAAK